MIEIHKIEIEITGTDGSILAIERFHNVLDAEAGLRRLVENANIVLELKNNL